MSGGSPVAVEGTDDMVYGLEVDVQAARQELQALLRPDGGAGGQEGGAGLGGMLGGWGLGGWAEQLKGLNLAELLDSPPPGVDEALAIAKVLQVLDRPEYGRFTRVVFDTAPTGHTLRLLALPDFLDTSVGKVGLDWVQGMRGGGPTKRRHVLSARGTRE